MVPSPRRSHSPPVTWHLACSRLLLLLNAFPELLQSLYNEREGSSYKKENGETKSHGGDRPGKKVDKVSFEKRSDWRRFMSSRGPSTKASNNGAPS